ncbi:MAG: DNA-directed DNA polymerase I [Desulfurococcales archaeon]|nr:DNA-directed DNA polymerase I [Desulfurococcales archaeon]
MKKPNKRIDEFLKLFENNKNKPKKLDERKRESQIDNTMSHKHHKRISGKTTLLDYLSGKGPIKESRPPENDSNQDNAYDVEESRHREEYHSTHTSRSDKDYRKLNRINVEGDVTVRYTVNATPAKQWWLHEPDNYRKEVSGYLLDVRYDGRLGKAVAFIYNPEDMKLYKWIDSTGHRPYFLVEHPPEKLRELGISLESHESFIMYDMITKYHPIKKTKIKVTKVIVQDPLAVKSMRKKLEARGIRFWEADIKYHHNYIHDHLLIPGMPYHVNRTWHKAGWKGDTSIVDKIFQGEPDETRETAKAWVPLFEHPPPEVPRIAVDIEVYTPEEGRVPDPDKATLPIISIGLADNNGWKKVLVLATTGQEFIGSDLPDDVEIEIFESEEAMLLEFFRIIERYPVVLTFNGDNFDLPYIYNRLRKLGFNQKLIPIEKHQDYITFRHILHVDLYKLFDIKALQVYAFGSKYREKNLDAVASALLGMKKEELEGTVSEVSLESLIKYNIRDAHLTMMLTTFAGNLVWNLIILLMRISKLGLEDVTRTQVSGWIKGLMTWEHRRRGWLIPSREEIKKIGGKVASKAIIEDKKYMGALVLEPPQGIFFNVMVVDFASLYPSIIKNWNLSYETVENPNCSSYKSIDIIDERGKKISEHKVCIDINGISSQIVGIIRDFRVKLYKKKAKMKDLPDTERLWYDTVQAALKVYINASYGVFGNESFNLYSPALAESVTAIGRLVLMDSLSKAREMDLVILYGDTDSLFIWDPPIDKLEELIAYVREKHGLELEVDKVFKIALFSGLKKNYIGVTSDGKIVIKGMVGKKSNAPEFIKKEFAKALDILSELRDPESVDLILERLRNHINNVYSNLKKKRYTLDELAINIMLSKNLEEYTKNTPQHVKAAMLLKRYGVPIEKGYIISFIKSRDKLGVKPVRLAKLADVDTSKYMEYVRTAFEQILLATGVRWSELTGSASKSLEKLLLRSG